MIKMVMNNRTARIGLSLGKDENGNKLGRLYLLAGLNEVDEEALDAVENQNYLMGLFEEPLPELGGRCALEVMGDKPKRKVKRKGKGQGEGKPDPDAE